MLNFEPIKTYYNMAKFTKENSSLNLEKKSQTEDANDDIITPFYFPPRADQMRQKEVAEMFSTTVQTVINWSASGKIPTFQLGKIPIYSRKLLIYTARNNRHLLKS